MSCSPPWWREASSLPLAFAQVREDPHLDRTLLEETTPEARVLLVASGGCTACYLAACPQVAALHVVDPNPAQLALTRLKLHLLQSAEPEDRLALLGHRPLAATVRHQQLAGLLDQLDLPPEVFGPPDRVRRWGPDYAGRYERLFAALATELAPHQEAIAAVLSLSDPAEQQRRTHPGTPLGARIDAAIGDVMSLPNLIALFGEEATNNPVQSFASHFCHQLHQVLETMPAARNPYLWQMLKGCYPPGGGAPWLTLRPMARLPAIEVIQGTMAEALRNTRARYQLIHLSNILDWLTPAKAADTLNLVAQRLAPGGRVVIRKLNSSLDIPRLGPQFVWENERARTLLARDASFFYRALHVGRCS